MPDSLSPPSTFVPKPFMIETIRVLGCPMECGVGVRGTAMGPAAFRTTGLLDSLRDLGHLVHDHGDASPDRDDVPDGGAPPLPRWQEHGRTARVLTELVASLFGRVVLDRPAARTRAVEADSC